jgi:hypothetical protein
MTVSGIFTPSERIEEKQVNGSIHICCLLLDLEIVMVAVFCHVHWYLKNSAFFNRPFICSVAMVTINTDYFANSIYRLVCAAER